MHSLIFVSYIFKTLILSEAPGNAPTAYSSVVRCSIDQATVTDLTNAWGMYLILGVQAGVLNRSVGGV